MPSCKPVDAGTLLKQARVLEHCYGQCKDDGTDDADDVDEAARRLGWRVPWRVTWRALWRVSWHVPWRAPLDSTGFPSGDNPIFCVKKNSAGP